MSVEQTKPATVTVEQTTSGSFIKPFGARFLAAAAE
jgi:hypothetical protein